MVTREGMRADARHGRRAGEPSNHDFRFSNRPFGVKRFLAIHHYDVDVARGLVLLL